MGTGMNSYSVKVVEVSVKPPAPRGRELGTFKVRGATHDRAMKAAKEHVEKILRRRVRSASFRADVPHGILVNVHPPEAA